jgi:replication factor A2
MWIDNDDPDAAAALKAELRPGTYARCFGSLRSFQNSKTLVAYSIRPVADFNEVTFHNLEVIYVQKQLSAKNGVARAPAGGAAVNAAFATAPPANAGYGGSYSAYSAPPQPAAGGGGAAFTGDIGADVLKVYNSPAGRAEQGLSIAVVAQQLGGRYQPQAIREAVEKLVNDGTELQMWEVCFRVG